MADVTGPISTLPGVVRRPPAGMDCDNGCGRAAELRVQGETDSFGCEMHDLCRPCWEQERKANASMSGPCDWCRKDANVLRPVRDPDEGMCGPVYYACAPCRGRLYDELAREAERYGESW